jgi:hypothetical protein
MRVGWYDVRVVRCEPACLVRGSHLAGDVHEPLSSVQVSMSSRACRGSPARASAPRFHELTKAPDGDLILIQCKAAHRRRIGFLGRAAPEVRVRPTERAARDFQARAARFGPERSAVGQAVAAWRAARWKPTAIAIRAGDAAVPFRCIARHAPTETAGGRSAGGCAPARSACAARRAAEWCLSVRVVARAAALACAAGRRRGTGEVDAGSSTAARRERREGGEERGGTAVCSPRTHDVAYLR